MNADEYEALPQAQRDRIQRGVEVIAAEWEVRRRDSGASAYYDLVHAVLQAADMTGVTGVRDMSEVVEGLLVCEPCCPLTLERCVCRCHR